MNWIFDFIDKKLYGFSLSEFNSRRLHRKIQSEILIDANGKIHIPRVSVDITKGCNLRCKHCSHLSPLMSGDIPKEELFSSFASWSQKIQPKKFGILGGEPLLHPHFEEIVLTAQQIWSHSEIGVVTNGILLNNLRDSFLEDIHRVGRICFVVSQHLESPEWTERFLEEQSRFAAFRIPLILRKSYSKWMVSYQLSADGRYIPYQSSPQKAWRVCAGRYFYKIRGDKMWYCTRLASVALAANEGLFGDEWTYILSHLPMTINNTQEDILAYLKQGSLAECSMCPDTVEFIKPQQIFRSHK